MNPSEAQISHEEGLHEHSRLVGYLQEIGIGDARHVQYDIVERLAGNLNLTDAFELSEQLRGVPKKHFSPKPVLEYQSTIKELKAYFIQERAKLLETLLRKSTPSAENRLLGLEAPESVEKLQRFYTLQQNEMEQHIHNLRLHIRETMMEISPEMQQLAMLDTILADIVAQGSRKSLSTLPRLLQKRFVRLLQEQHKELDLQEPNGYALIINIIQNLLLAECDTRLLPLIGLLEALEEEEDQKRK